MVNSVWKQFEKIFNTENTEGTEKTKTNHR
jgi:hypothetical protein